VERGRAVGRAHPCQRRRDVAPAVEAERIAERCDRRRRLLAVMAIDERERDRAEATERVARRRQQLSVDGQRRLEVTELAEARRRPGAMDAERQPRRLPLEADRRPGAAAQTVAAARERRARDAELADEHVAAGADVGEAGLRFAAQ